MRTRHVRIHSNTYRQKAPDKRRQTQPSRTSTFRTLATLLINVFDSRKLESSQHTLGCNILLNRKGSFPTYPSMSFTSYSSYHLLNLLDYSKVFKEITFVSKMRLNIMNLAMMLIVLSSEVAAGGPNFNAIVRSQI